jgi:uncharacterized protein
MKHKIIGRSKEIRKLDDIFVSEEAEFLALYGRRRVGKTYLIRQHFLSKPCLFFETTGLKDGTLSTQLDLFTRSLEKSFYKTGGIRLEKPGSWLDAFKMLNDQLETLPKNKKVVLFFDELPWLASRRSAILQAIDYYWNTSWSQNPRLTLIVCGSAASWMIDKFINAKGGLYNRLTARIHLQPFNLNETRQYLEYLGIKMDDTQILELYMAMGGIPFYLKSVSKGLSAAQNINDICFQPTGLLLNEFDTLFSSLFDHADAHLEIMRTLAKHRMGLSQKELLEKTRKSSSGGTFKKRLGELEEAGFVAAFIPYGKSKKGTYYRVIDEYTLFYLHWIQPVRRKLIGHDTHYWQAKSQTQQWKTWAGYAFEAVCFKHSRQICRKLDIQMIAKETGSWRLTPSKNDNQKTGTQIDLLFDRADGIINICEIKHYNKLFTIDKTYAQRLRYKLDAFKEQTKTNKQLFLTMITLHGVTWNAYADELVSREVTLADLFN